jgi:hypothetical protein
MITTVPDISLGLLHEGMFDKTGKVVTTSLTLIDIHDLARSSRTYEMTNFYVAHPADTLRKLAQTLHYHWEEGFGSKYNPNRTEALSRLKVVTSLDDIVADITTRTGQKPVLVATCAKDWPNRVTFANVRARMAQRDRPWLVLLGTGWGMSEPLIQRTDLFLEPILGPGDFNHLSVRAAGAIILDRLCRPE